MSNNLIKIIAAAGFLIGLSVGMVAECSESEQAIEPINITGEL